MVGSSNKGIGMRFVPGAADILTLEKARAAKGLALAYGCPGPAAGALRPARRRLSGQTVFAVTSEPSGSTVKRNSLLPVFLPHQ